MTRSAKRFAASTRERPASSCTRWARQDLLDLGPVPPAEEAMAPALERMYVMLVAVCERMLGGQSGGQELLIALDGCAVGADGPNGSVLRYRRGLQARRPRR